jgi:hypothetical protein
MILRWICLGCLAAALAGCALQPRPPEIGYLPPSAPPGMPRSALVRQPAFLVWGNVVDRLQQEEGLALAGDDAEGRTSFGASAGQDRRRQAKKSEDSDHGRPRTSCALTRIQEKG